MGCGVQALITPERTDRGPICSAGPEMRGTSYVDQLDRCASTVSAEYDESQVVEQTYAAGRTIRFIELRQFRTEESYTLGRHSQGASVAPRNLCQHPELSGRHSTSSLLTPLNRVTAWPSSALLPKNPTQSGRKSHLLLACWRVSKGTGLLKSSFLRSYGTAGSFKTGTPHGSTSIHQERKLRSNAW